MHYFMNLCACCLQSDRALSEYSIKNERNCQSPNNYIQQIQTIYPDLQLNYTLPFQLCNDCKRMMNEATQIKQYLEYQQKTEQSHKLLLKENTCSGCLEIYLEFFSQVFFVNALEVCEKSCIDLLREALPQFKVDSYMSYKYCKFCSNSIKSLYLLKTLITRNSALYATYCSKIFSTKDFQSLKFSQLWICVPRTAITRLNINFEEITIKEEICTQDNTIELKVENDDCYQQNYSFHKEQPKNEQEMCHQDNYFTKYICNETDYLETPSSSDSTLLTNNQILTLPEHNNIGIELKSYDKINSLNSCIAKVHLKEYENTDANKPHKSNHCKNSLTESHTLIEHKRIHTGEKPYKCTYCPKSFTQNYVLLMHERIHTGEKPFKCNYCKKSFTQSNFLIEHKRIHTGEKPYNCNYCTKSFITSTKLKEHERIHSGEKPYNCNYCTKSFITSCKLKVHERIHTGEKPYNCNYCTKSFITSTKLKEHERIHSGEKPFKCTYCTKSFTQNNALTRHERIHTGEKPYNCNYCTKSFITGSKLKEHERIHTGEKPYKCTYCTKSFTQNNALTRHERIHAGEMPYKCNYCKKSFTQNNHLKEHERIHIGEKA